MVNMGATVFSCGPGVTAADRQLAHGIFSAIGIVAEMPEDKLDAVTALSGSGPAFLFAYVEAMVDGARQLGLDPAVAQDLLVQTMAGSAEMLKCQLGSPAALRQAVTSKGGTTAAGLASLEQDDFHGALVRCLQAAAARAAELGR
jgi:pyrroline-5-carboxylate reductase